MDYAFISYSSKNRDEADSLRNLLQRKGLSAWMAPHDIPAGKKYAGVINKAVRECGCFILLLSDASQNSVWVAKEVERAVNYEKSIITIQLEDVVLNDEFELYISSEQMVAVPKIDEDSENMQKVLKAICALLGEADALEEEPEIEGELLKGTYMVGTKTGEGGFGAVHHAYNRQTDEECAIKISRLPKDKQSYVSEETIERIKEIDSPYLCKVLDSFSHKDRLCVVEEMLYRYTNLRDYVAITKKPDKEVIKLMLGALKGLEALHKGGVFHGDISPYNILVSTEGEVKIVDYSSSFLIGGPPTADHTLVLTYRAPDFEYTAQSEVYSMGASIIDAITGAFVKKPGYGNVIFRSTIDENLKDILIKAVADNPADRFDSMAALRKALEAYALS